MKMPLRWTWIVAGMLTLLILAIPLPASFAAPSEREFHIQASRFQYVPAIMKVNPGDRVTIDLAATDVVHGLSIDGYDLEITADPGQTAQLSFIANQPGAFRFRCSVTCGNLHPFMMGKLYVGENTLFWRASGLLLLVVGLGIWKLWK